MLPRQNRLDIKANYQKLKKEGLKASTIDFSVYLTMMKGLPENSKINAIISKKAVKKAVNRNRIRRLLHTAAGTLFKDNVLELNVLVVVYKDFSSLKSPQVLKQLADLFEKLILSGEKSFKK